ncbi:hypothetical protein ABT084_18260 [Streptomyces sp. NPDC002138]|uniref:hypothetical protein n=1 Tax=Streptomyces sp. NPDC002138 TaxID=3154410 RepID=UPI003326ADED
MLAQDGCAAGDDAQAQAGGGACDGMAGVAQVLAEGEAGVRVGADLDLSTPCCLSTGVHLAMYSATLTAACLASTLAGDTTEEHAHRFYQGAYRHAYERPAPVTESTDWEATAPATCCPCPPAPTSPPSASTSTFTPTPACTTLPDRPAR